MDAYGGIEVVVAPGQCDAGGTVLQRRSGENGVDDALFRERIQHLVTVLVKGAVGVVAVGVKNLRKHRDFLSPECLCGCGVC